MKWIPYLKRLRVVLALLFFVLTFMVLVDFRNLFPPGLIKGILFLQFAPSVMKFLEVLSWGALGFAVVIILTLLVGRLYCSSICPVGILQDIIARLQLFVRRKKRYRYTWRKALNPMRNGVLVVTIIFLLLGSSFMVLVLDPFSNFGRIQANLTRPVLMGITNLSSIIFKYLGSYAVSSTPMTGFNPWSALFSFAFLLLILLTSLRRGRWFCNYLCPVGTLLGWISKVSVFKVRLNRQACTDCKACALSCKAECIDLRNYRIDYSRCVDCFNCLDACKFDALTFAVQGSSQRSRALKSESLNVRYDGNRRLFLMGSMTMLGTMVGIRQLARAQNAEIPPKPKQDTTIPEERAFPVSPPGSLSLRHYTRQCTACHLCVSSCPTQVLQPSLLQFGIEGIFQPRMDFHAGFCNYECTLCADVCPSGAILPLEKERKKREQIGVAKFIKESCVVYTDETLCGACNEHCPTKAVKMIPYKDTLLIPKMQDDQCIGCGACENVCPTRPFRAIYVDGNEVHATSREPDKVEFDKSVLEEFPF